MIGVLSNLVVAVVVGMCLGRNDLADGGFVVAFRVVGKQELGKMGIVGGVDYGGSTVGLVLEKRIPFHHH